MMYGYNEKLEPFAKKVDNCDSISCINNEYDTGIKETDSKLIYDIDFEYIKGMAERMQLNRDKYPVGNWTKPIDVESLKQALFRHTIEIMQGNYSDEQKFGHLYAIGCNAFMIVKQLQNG